MVTLAQAESSNSLIPTTLPPHLVAVFVGATKGIGLVSLKAFVRHARQPRVYFIGRSKSIGERVAQECKELNPEGEYVFIEKDVSLIKNVDEVCKEIRGKEEVVNLLFQTQGTLRSGIQTTENLHLVTALTYYSRLRFTVNLLPLLKRAPSLRRCISVFAGTKEGPINATDFQGLHIPLLSSRGHFSSLITLGHAAVAKTAPEVAFVHDFPGPVKTSLLDDVEGVMAAVARVLFRVFGGLFWISDEECGERHCFLATSARFAVAGKNGQEGGGGNGVPLQDGVETAKGTDGEVGSGCYSVGSEGESAGPKVLKLLRGLTVEGMVEKVWEHTEEEFVRITGVVAI